MLLRFGVFLQVFDATEAEMPRVGQVFDVTMAHVCHEHPLPANGDQCLVSSDVRNMHAALTLNAQLQEMTSRLQLASKLKLLPVLQEMAQRIDDQVLGKSKRKLVLYSGHDTGIAALILALDVSDSLWPPFASRVTFELLRSTDVTSSSKHYINIIYNGLSVTNRAQWCRNKLVDDKLCPLSVFSDHVRSGLLHDLGFSSYEKACDQPG